MNRRLQTNEWDTRVGFGIAGIICTDTFFFHQKTVGKEREDSCPNEFFSKLADEMITNTIVIREMRARNVSPTAGLDSGEEEMTNNMPNIEVDNQNEGRFWKQHGWIKEEGAGEMQGQMWKREYSRLQQVYTPDESNPAAVLVL